MMSIRNALIFAGLILAASLCLALAVRSDLIDPSTSKRAGGVIGGIVLVVFANLVPKTLEPHSRRCSTPKKTQAVQRFTGWTLVLAGLGYSLAWLVLPVDLAKFVAMSLVATGLVLVVTRAGWALMRRSHAQPPAEL